MKLVKAFLFRAFFNDQNALRYVYERLKDLVFVVWKSYCSCSCYYCIIILCLLSSVDACVFCIINPPSRLSSELGYYGRNVSSRDPMKKWLLRWIPYNTAVWTQVFTMSFWSSLHGVTSQIERSPEGILVKFPMYGQITRFLPWSNPGVFHLEVVAPKYPPNTWLYLLNRFCHVLSSVSSSYSSNERSNRLQPSSQLCRSPHSKPETWGMQET